MRRWRRGDFIRPINSCCQRFGKQRALAPLWMRKIVAFETLARLGRELAARVTVNEVMLDLDYLIEEPPVAEVFLFQCRALRFRQFAEQVPLHYLFSFRHQFVVTTLSTNQ